MDEEMVKVYRYKYNGERLEYVYESMEPKPRERRLEWFVIGLGVLVAIMWFIIWR